MRDFQTGHFVGTYLNGPDGRLYLCVAYDPSVDYYVCTVDDQEPRFTDISTRAIGRTFHEDYGREPFSRPDVLVAVVARAYAEAEGEPVTDELDDLIEDIPFINSVYVAAKVQFSAWKKQRLGEFD